MSQMLNDSTFSAQSVQTFTGGTAVARQMRYGSTIAKSLFLLTLTGIFAYLGWQNTSAAAALGQGGPGLLWFLGYLFLIGLTIAAAANPRIAPVAGLVYAVVMGVWIGYVSRIYSVYYDGIVAMALLASLATVFGTLLLYSIGVIRVTPKFVRVISGALLGLMLTYAISWIFGLFGADLSFLYGATPTGIAFSLLITVLAALTLATDFEFIKQGVENGAPASMEWYAAFGLVSSLVWLYVEILRLLALLARSR